MPAHPGYDPDATSMAINQAGGSSLDPLTMIHKDVQTAFKIIGDHKKDSEEEARLQAALAAEVENLKAQISTLQTRLWGLLAGVILALIGGAVTWLTT